METWQMIKELTENPHKKFKSKTSNYVVKTKPSTFYTGLEIDLGEFFIDEEWEEVKEPVDFYAAIHSGRRIKPVTFGGSYMTISQLQEVLCELTEETITKYYLGDWYID